MHLINIFILKTCWPRSMQSSPVFMTIVYCFGSYKIWTGFYLKRLISIFLVFNVENRLLFSRAMTNTALPPLLLLTHTRVASQVSKVKSNTGKILPNRDWLLRACRNKRNSFNHITGRTVSMWSVQILIFLENAWRCAKYLLRCVRKTLRTLCALRQLLLSFSGVWGT